MRSLPSKVLCVVSLVLLGTFLNSFSAFAEGTEFIDQVLVNVPISCTIRGTGTNSHNAEILNGTVNSSIGDTTVKVVCNDNGGFAVYAIGFTDDTDGKNVLASTTLGSTYDIITGTATGPVNNNDVSNWAMKLSTVTNPTPAFPVTIQNSFDSFHAVPSSSTLVAKRTSATDMGDSAVGSIFNTTYQAYIAKEQPADTYTGKVKYTLVHPNTEAPAQPQTTASGKICYYANSAVVEGTMGCQEVASSDTSAKLFASNFSRAGYGFAGWSDAYDYGTNANAHFYGPNEDITFTAGDYTGSNPGLSLYAVWVPSAGSFQDSSKTTTVCNGLTAASVSGTRTLASVSALTDTRDNQTYAIAKLADGNCWMIENLRIDNTAQLTTLNTNNPLSEGTSVTLKHNYADAQTYNTLSATSSVAYDADTAPDGWCKLDSATCDDQSRLRTDNTANRASYASGATMSTGANLYTYGNYYNWYSATAGRGTYGFNSNNSSTVGDLCPTNWRLPKGGDKSRIVGSDDNEFWNLIVDALNGGTNPANYSSEDMPFYSGAAEAGPVNALIRTWPNNFVHSGYVNGASLNSRGTDGFYWSSTVNSSNNAYSLRFYGTNVYLATYGNEYYGRAIRCMAQSLSGS
ncbi:hypothetical protein IKF28_03025 [Candidatus Saccharibacteria bacterium]|nr:hypothetical protein [Candidatus Saccharibacteria bacterium]